MGTTVIPLASVPKKQIQSKINKTINFGFEIFFPPDNVALISFSVILFFSIVLLCLRF